MSALVSERQDGNQENGWGTGAAGATSGRYPPAGPRHPAGPATRGTSPERGPGRARRGPRPARDVCPLVSVSGSSDWPGWAYISKLPSA